MVNLSKGQKISLEKSNGSKLENFCVGVNWGAIETKGFLGFKKMVDVDLDLSCIILDENKKMIDYIYSPYYRTDVLSKFGLQPGKLQTNDSALKHSGDDLQGDDSIDDADNEIISVELKKVNAKAKELYFFLNNVGNEDFSQIPYAKLRMFEGTPERVTDIFASYNVSAESRYNNKRALILGKLIKNDNNWNFVAIGDPTEDSFIGQTIARILEKY